jgi:hypothetical protein
MLASTAVRSKSIDKLGVLNVCEVEELLVLQSSVAGLGSYLSLLLIPSSAGEVDESEIENTDPPADDDSDFCGPIGRTTEGLRT